MKITWHFTSNHCNYFYTYNYRLLDFKNEGSPHMVFISRDQHQFSTYPWSILSFRIKVLCRRHLLQHIVHKWCYRHSKPTEDRTDVCFIQHRNQKGEISVSSFQMTMLLHYYLLHIILLVISPYTDTMFSHIELFSYFHFTI